MPDNPKSPDPIGILDGYSSAITAEYPSGAEELELVSNLQRRFEEAKAARTERERVWERNRYLLQYGDATLAFNAQSATVLRVVTARDPRFPRSTDNLMRINHRAFVGKLVRIINTARVIPRTRDRDDMLAAEIMDSWIDYCWQSMHLQLIYKRWVEPISWAGTGVLCLSWNPLAGQDVPSCPQCNGAFPESDASEPCPMCLMQSEGAQATPPMLSITKQGALKAQLVSTRDFYPDPGAAELEDCQWVDVSQVLPVAHIRSMFPERSELIRAEGDLYRSRYLYSPSSSLLDARLETRTLDDHARLHCFHERPTGQYRKGRIVYMACDRILEIRPNTPYLLLDRFPVYLARGDRTDDELWGEDIISQAEPPHHERNITISQMRRQREMGLNPRSVTTHNSGISKDRLTATPGEVIKLKSPGATLRWQEPPPFPPWVANEPQRLKDSVREKWGVTVAEMGAAPASQSGRAAAFQETQATETITPLLIEIDSEWLEFQRGLVVLGRHYTPPEQVWTITGRGRVMTTSWGHANVQPGWDVYLAKDDALSKIPALRLQNSMDLLKLGRYTDQATGLIDWQAFDRHAGINLASTTGDPDSAEHIYAAQLPEAIEQAIIRGEMDPMTGQIVGMPQPKPWDDARIIVDELMAWLRTTGRSKPEPIQRAVGMLWYSYAIQILQSGPRPDDTKRLAPLGAMQQQQGPPGMGAGAQPQGGLNQPTQPTPTASQETAQHIQGADRFAERTARGSKPQEGR